MFWVHSWMCLSIAYGDLMQMTFWWLKNVKGTFEICLGFWSQDVPHHIGWQLLPSGITSKSWASHQSVLEKRNRRKKKKNKRKNSFFKTLSHVARCFVFLFFYNYSKVWRRSIFRIITIHKNLALVLWCVIGLSWNRKMWWLSFRE